MTEVSQEQIDAAIFTDKRFAIIDMAAAVAAELRDSSALGLFMASLRREAEDALVAFADANIANVSEIVPLQVRVQAVVFLNRTIEQLLAKAKVSEEQLISENERPAEYDD